MCRALLLACLFWLHADSSLAVNVNYGYFKEPAGHLWTYAIDGHSWTDTTTVPATTFSYTYWPQTSGGKVIEKLQTGELDIAHLGNAPWGAGSTRGTPAKMLYVIHSKDLSQILVCRQGIQEPAHLVGKRLAYIRGSTTHYMLEGLLAQTQRSLSEFDWIGHMGAGDQRSAWDKGEIDCGYMWGGNMRYLQENPWCSSPDTSSSEYRGPCAAEGKGLLGYSLYTGGMSKRWAKETWNNLVVTDAFAAAHPRTVYRSVKVAATADTKLVQDVGWYKNSVTRVCDLAIGCQISCGAIDTAFVYNALSFDTWLDYTTQQSGDYVGERVAGECAKETIGQYPNNDGTCTKDTMSGSAWSTWATAEFGYKLKNFPYLPSYAYYQSTMDASYIDDVGTAGELFPSITPASLAALNVTWPLTDPAHTFCGDLTQPITLTTPGTFKDHEGGGFHQDGVTCVWQIDQTSAVLLDNIDVQIERDQDNVYIYEGLCTGGDCESLPLLAKFSGGKGTSAQTLHNVGPRPPVFVSGGEATIVFQPDGTADRPLSVIVDDGVSMTWSLATAGVCPLTCQNGGSCVNGACQCVNGWAGADCGFDSCLGTLSLSATSTAGAILHGPSGTETSHNADCRWVITADTAASVVALEFTSLDIDWLFDPIRIYDGDGVGGTLLGTYSGYLASKLGSAVGQKCPGAYCPALVVSPGQTVTVRWTSDAIQSGQGFELGYTSVLPAATTCGYGAVSNCAGQGACGASGCACNQGWYGPFCQVPQCLFRSGDKTTASGTIRNMAASESAYAPERDCSWLVKPPASSTSVQPGAISFKVKKFDLEAASSSSDELQLGNLTFTGLSPPCSEDIACTSDADCLGGVCGASTCTCSPIVIPGDQAWVYFKTDANDYPLGSLHAGFEVDFEAVYVCERDGAGYCLTPFPCSPGAVSQTINGEQVCMKCPAGQKQDFHATTFLPQCTLCPPGSFADESGLTKCSECRAGYSCPLGATAELPCAVGTMSGAGNSSCSLCPVGRYTMQTTSVDCLSCGAGKQVPDLWTTMRQITTDGALTWVLLEGAENSSACGCKPDYRQDASGECIECIDGMDCRGMSEIWIEEGYYSEPALSVYECYLNPKACIGAKLGEPMCAVGREGLGCAECEDDTTEGDDGTCEPCEGGNMAPFIVACIIAFGVLCGLYYSIDTENEATKPKALQALVFLGTLCILNLQQLGVVSTMSVEFAEPAKTLMEIANLFNFDMEVLQMGCIFGKRSPTLVYAMKVCVILAALVVVMIVHVIFVAVQHKGDFAKRMSSLTAIIGTLFMVFITSMVSATIAPFECREHPNDKSTVRRYPTVVCGDDTHMEMVGLAVPFLLIPLSYVAFCAYIVKQAPLACNRGDIEFMKKWRFLFRRFRSETYWYVLWFMSRNVLVALAPTLNSAILQVMIVVTLLSMSLALIAWFRPWCIMVCNRVDVLLCTGMVVAVSIVGFFAANDSLGQAANVVAVFIVLNFLALAVGMGRTVYKLVSDRNKKEWKYFLCHHKGGAGAFCRLLKLQFQDMSNGSIKVWLDCDDLQNLEMLFDYVGCMTDNVVVNMSKELFYRPWCMGELVTAHLKKVNMVAVKFPDYAELDANFIENYNIHVDISCLTPHSISLAMVQDMLTYVRTVEPVTLPKALTSSVVEGLCKWCETGSADAKQQMESKPKSEQMKVMVVVDHSNWEAVSTALVLVKLYRKETSDINMMPAVLDIGDEFPPSAECAIFVLSNGSFTQGPFIKTLLEVEKKKAKFLPIISEDAFRFPSKAMLAEIETMAPTLFPAFGIKASPEFIALTVAGVFKEIAITFTPQDYSANEILLQVKARAVVSRVRGGKLRGLTTEEPKDSSVI